MYSRRILLILLPLLAIACSLSTVLGPTAPPAATSKSVLVSTSLAVPAASSKTVPAPAPIAPPQGWKLSKDASGVCQVSTPPDWLLGRDFYMKAESANPGPNPNKPGHYPPTGLALWQSDKSTPLPKGKWFQIRTSLVSGGQVCSVWRIKESVDFTTEEKSTMALVGKTLQEVR